MSMLYHSTNMLERVAPLLQEPDLAPLFLAYEQASHVEGRRGGIHECRPSCLRRACPEIGLTWLTHGSSSGLSLTSSSCSFCSSSRIS